MAISSTSSCSPSPATSTSSRTMSSSSPSASSCHAGTCNMVPGTSSTTSVPVITSFAMKGDSVSPGPARATGDIQPDILSPMDMDEMLSQLQDCNAIRYAAYRTASKLDLLRSALRLDLVKLGAVSNVFHQRGYSKTSKANRASPSSEINQVLLDRSKAADIITDIFFAAGKVRTYYSPILDVSACTETTLTTALMVYNSRNESQPQNRGFENSALNISVKALKTFFVVLCEARLKDKFSYLFREFADGDGTTVRLSKNGLSDLLETLCQLPQFLGESTSFGSHMIPAATAQCFDVADDKELGKGLLAEADLMKWLLREPQVIVWLPTFYRLLSAKGVRHGIRCANCKVKDITGMRYQCLRCMRYDLCQHCFFYGLSNRGHRLDHPMREYCYRSSKRDTTKAWIRLIINNLVFVGRRSSSDKNSKKRFLPHDPRLDKQANLAASSEPAKRRLKIDHNLVAGNKDEVDGMEEDDSSGFDSAISSNQDCGAAVTCDSPAARVSQPFNININRNNQVPGIDKMKFLKKREAEFNAILHHLEQNNAQMLDKLKMFEKIQKRGGWDFADQQDSSVTNISLNQPLRNCQSIQQQLDRLKELMENVFSVANENRPTNPNCQTDVRRNNQISKLRNSVILEMNSLNDPSFMVESTPVVSTAGINNNNRDLAGIKNKKLSRLALDNNFSPIVFQVPRTPPPFRPKVAPEASQRQVTLDVSAAVDTYLNDDEEMKTFEDDPQTLSNVSLADLTSLLAKTGFHGQTKLDLNITDVLQQNVCQTEHVSGLDVMEDLESLLQRLEDVFQSFHDPSLAKKNTFAYNNDAVIIGQIVSEIGDQLEAFAHHYRDSIAPVAN